MPLSDTVNVYWLLCLVSIIPLQFLGAIQAGTMFVLFTSLYLQGVEQFLTY